MNNRINAVIMVLLMVLSVVASGLNTAPNTTQNVLNENTSESFSHANGTCSGNDHLRTNLFQNDSGTGGDVGWSEITGNNVSHFGALNATSNDTIDEYCVNLNPGESIIISSMCASNATDCNNSSIAVKMFAYSASNYTGNWVNLTSNILSYPTFTNNLTTDQVYGFSFGVNGAVEMYYSYHIWKTGGNSTGGNGSGNNTGPMEWLAAWAGGSNFTSNSTIGVNWSAGDLVTNITYNVTLDVYAHNSTTNTTYVIWDDYTVFNATSNASSGVLQIPSGTLPTGCYYASVGLYDNDDGMHFDNDGFDLDVGMDCSNTGGNGSGNNTGNASGAFVNAWPTDGNGSISDYEMSSTDANITIGAFNLTNGSNYYLDWQITDLVTGILVDSDVWNWTATNLDRVEWYDATNLGQGCYYFEVSLYEGPAFVEYEDWPFTIDMTFAECNNTGGNGTSMVNINWINTTASSGGGDAEISVESSGNWTAYWGITNTNSASSFPSWSYTNGWWNASASGGLGTTTGSGDFTWIFQDMDNWGALAPPSCNILMIALFDGNPGTAAAQSTPATGDPVSIDFQTFELGNFTAADCNWDSSWGGNNTGGNNTGNNTGNTTDCGTLDNLTDLMVWTDHTMYNEGDNVEGTFYTNCTVLNKTYTIDYMLFDSNNNSVSDNSANPWTWIANNVAESHSMNWTGLTADTYCLWAHLEDAFAAQSVDSDTYCFDVIASSTAWGNGTARFIYIKPLAQNADEHTPFNLTFPAPPMADNSPYLSNMICSKTVGHSADVWETYVPMPFNNITSWKVENTYGIVMGMFVMNDAQAAGISTMQNPTVIFEQDLSFSGHAPSTLVDQAYFNCPMVTVYSTLSPVMSPGGSVLSYVAGLSVNNSGGWIGDLNWEVATVTNGSSTALMDVGGHLLIEASGALLDHNFSPTGIAADEICLNWELIDESGVELSSGSECIDFIPLSVPTTNTAPHISSVGIAPSSPLESDVLTCSYTYTDVENDPDVSSVTWMINGVTATTTGSTLSSGYATGDSVICSVFAYDGVDYGNVESSTVIIASNSTSTGGGSSSGGGLPAIGAVGTLAAIGAGFFAILRRENDE